MRSLVIMQVYSNRRGGPLVNVIAGFGSLKILTLQRAMGEFGRWSHSENLPYSLCLPEL